MLTKHLKTLVMAIVDRREDNQIALLTDARFKLLQERSETLLMRHASRGTPMPRFESTRLVSGVMCIECADSISRGWLSRNIPNISKEVMWPSINLRIMEFSKIPKPMRIHAWFPGSSQSTKDMFTLIEAQNPGIGTNGWLVLVNNVVVVLSWYWELTLNRSMP